MFSVVFHDRDILKEILYTPLIIMPGWQSNPIRATQQLGETGIIPVDNG